MIDSTSAESPHRLQTRWWNQGGIILLTEKINSERPKERPVADGLLACHGKREQ
jgi:hypothetical protein